MGEQMHEIDWATAPSGEIWEWRYPDPAAHTHIACDLENDEVYFRSVHDGSWSPGGPNVKGMLFNLTLNGAWQRVVRPEPVIGGEEATANEALNNLEDKLVGLLYTHEVDYPCTDTLADSVRAAFDELRGRRAHFEDDDLIRPITISEDRGE